MSLNADVYNNDQQEKSMDQSYLIKIENLNTNINDMLSRNRERDLLLVEMRDDILSITDQITAITV